jgi:hypothetical protein
MEIFDAINIAEGGDPTASDEKRIEAWQTLIDEGWSNSLGSWFRETAEKLIATGICTPRQPKGDK